MFENLKELSGCCAPDPMEMASSLPDITECLAQPMEDLCCRRKKGISLKGKEIGGVMYSPKVFKYWRPLQFVVAVNYLVANEDIINDDKIICPKGFIIPSWIQLLSSNTEILNAIKSSVGDREKLYLEYVDIIQNIGASKYVEWGKYPLIEQLYLNNNYKYRYCIARRISELFFRAAKDALDSKTDYRNVVVRLGGYNGESRIQLTRAGYNVYGDDVYGEDIEKFFSNIEKLNHFQENNFPLSVGIKYAEKFVDKFEWEAGLNEAYGLPTKYTYSQQMDFRSGNVVDYPELWLEDLKYFYRNTLCLQANRYDVRTIDDTIEQNVKSFVAEWVRAIKEDKITFEWRGKSLGRKDNTGKYEYLLSQESLNTLNTIFHEIYSTSM